MVSSTAEKDVLTVLGADICTSAMDARATTLGMNARLINDLDHRYKYSKHYRVPGSDLGGGGGG